MRNRSSTAVSGTSSSDIFDIRVKLNLVRKSQAGFVFTERPVALQGQPAVFVPEHSPRAKSGKPQEYLLVAFWESPSPFSRELAA
ncbi:hypothetical protein AHiyo6_03300 [Arthrobacter sp. Hiyo6]|jgi:hypothetical protein|nr:hypothetical protein AHiyo6_03300 [Arthrobacter sp. Hiyo6]